MGWFLTLSEGFMEVGDVDHDDDRVNIKQSASGRWTGRVLQLSFWLNWICIHSSSRDNSSFNLNTLGLLRSGNVFPIGGLPKRKSSIRGGLTSAQIFWYFFSLQVLALNMVCWKNVCSRLTGYPSPSIFFQRFSRLPVRIEWYQSSGGETTFAVDKMRVMQTQPSRFCIWHCFQIRTDRFICHSPFKRDQISLFLACSTPIGKKLPLFHRSTASEKVPVRSSLQIWVVCEWVGGWVLNFKSNGPPV